MMIRSISPMMGRSALPRALVRPVACMSAGHSRLHQTMTNREKELAGEVELTRAITIVCPDLEIIDTSGVAAHSDIHVMHANGHFVAFECKNKAVITRADTEKSCRDIAHMKQKYGDRLIGYMFVSLRSSNIPHKRFFQFIDGVPTIWFGTDANSTPELLPRVISMMMRIASDIRATESCDPGNAEYMKESVQISDEINSIHDAIVSNKRAIASASKAIAKLAQNNEVMWNSLARLSKSLHK